jgi:hypothetical protein
VCICKDKEGKFFSRFTAAEEIRPLDVLRYELTCFGHYGGQRYVGDFDPGYMYMEKHPRCIIDIVGAGAKAILALRSPARRAFSEYHHSNISLGIDKPFVDYLVPGTRMFDRSLYSRYVGRVFEAFGRDQCLVLLFEEITPAGAMFLAHRLWGFLELTPVMVNSQGAVGQTASSQLRLERFNYNDTDPAQKSARAKLEPTYLSIRNGKVQAAHRGVSAKTADLIEHMRRVVTTELSEAEEKEINRRLFRDEIKRTEDLIGTSLEAWL